MITMYYQATVSGDDQESYKILKNKKAF